MSLSSCFRAFSPITWSCQQLIFAAVLLLIISHDLQNVFKKSKKASTGSLAITWQRNLYGFKSCSTVESPSGLCLGRDGFMWWKYWLMCKNRSEIQGSLLMRITKTTRPFKSWGKCLLHQVTTCIFGLCQKFPISHGTKTFAMVEWFEKILVEVWSWSWNLDKPVKDVEDISQWGHFRKGRGEGAFIVSDCRNVNGNTKILWILKMYAFHIYTIKKLLLSAS